MAGIPRRTILTHGGLVAGAATASGIGLHLGRPETAEAVRLDQLHVSQLRVVGSARHHPVGSTRTLRGLLHLTSDGPEVGTFFSTAVVLAEPDLIDPVVGYLETQLFTLPGGTVTGVGTVHHDGRGQFTVTGGSGLHVDLRGAYASLQTADHSGTGTATFTFDPTEPPCPQTLT